MGDASAGAQGAAGAGGGAFPPATLALLVGSLAAQAQVHLGLVPHPGTGKPQKNLVAAKHAIDLLDVLEAKTKGNLDPDESALLAHVLYDLRLAYVRSVRGA